jgi:urea transporter
MEAAAPPPSSSSPGPPSGAASDYPVRFDVEYPERLSRWKIFLKWLFAIPHFIIVYLLGIVAGVLILIAFFAILFTKKWPRSLFDFTVMIQRWTFNVYAYAVLLLRDEYPPFSGDSGEYPLVLEVEYREDLSRWQIFVKWLLAIPHLLVLAVLGIAVSIVVLIAFFAILFTGRYPRGMFDFVVGTTRWYARVNAYAFWLMTDRYPPFSLK